MKALIQRVSSASVSVGSECVGSIGRGLLVFLGIEKHDDDKAAEAMVQKVLKYRVFADDEGKMNRSLLDVQGDLLVVSQFTLVAETSKGLRPGFSNGASPELGRELYEVFVECARQQTKIVQSGIFGADMQVSLCNDGPVTFNLQV